MWCSDCQRRFAWSGRKLVKAQRVQRHTVQRTSLSSNRNPKVALLLGGVAMFLPCPVVLVRGAVIFTCCVWRRRRGQQRFAALVALTCSTIAAVARSSEQRDWPFYVPENGAPPAVTDVDWVRNDIDRFILSELETNELEPAPEAAQRTLVRRLYFDLIGLPPRPEAVDAFLNNHDGDAYSKLVEQLLSDPRYGERWARFWLDLARYADTAGYEGDPDLPHAWRYRDYVIDAFNNDKPYDLFIREQLAGDEFDEIMGAGDLPDTPPERIVAMTFLRLAPFTEPRGDETRHEMLSEVTGTVGSVFLGLTVGCAKCHDHKHDQISTADFYRMKAFFATVQIPRPERGVSYQIGGSIDARFYRSGEQAWAASSREKLTNQLASAETQLAELREKIALRLGMTTSAGFGVQLFNQQANDYFFDRRSVSDASAHMAIAKTDGKQWSIDVDGKAGSLGSLSGANRGNWFASVSNPSYVSLGQYTAGEGQPKGGEHLGKFAEVMIYDRPLAEAELGALKEYFDQKYGHAPATNSTLPMGGLRFWLDASDLDADAETPNPAAGAPVASWIDKVGRLNLAQAKPELQPKCATLGPKQAAAVEFAGDFLSGMLGQASFLHDRQGSLVIVFSAIHQHEGYGFEVGGQGDFLATFTNPAAADKNDPLKKLIEEGDSRVTLEERRHYEYLSTRDRFVKQHLKRLQPVAMSLRHSYGPPYEPGVPTSRIMIRGEYDNAGDVVEPGFLSAITGNQAPAPIRLDPFRRWPTRSRRMALADWIASPANPLTARVMVNRLWHWHFGQGLVRTPSDFGYLSGGPSHQELLDWLALKFIEEKWSIKAMHRLMVNSATYRQVSAHSNTKAAIVDPDNRLLWRTNRRRLEAEAIRDNVLAVSGQLNREQFGLPIFPPLPGDLADTVKYSESKWDTQYGAEGRKRSIYIYQQRTLTMPFLQTFDALVCDQSRARRRASVTPLQALAIYNGDFVNEEAKHFAARVQQVAGDDAQRQIKVAFETALGRPPSEAEADHLRKLLGSGGSADEGLVGVCRVLYNANEFVYVD